MRRSAACSAMLLLVLVLTAFATPSPLPAGAPTAAAAPAATESDEPPATALQHIVTTQTISFVQIAAGGSHTCGLTNTGLVYCWGWNAYGQLGDGTRTDLSLIHI
ncbi:MAG: RCC1 domain-containing protein, partial [Chloroflexaceae bacterium]|nr:RCC1 domain-containing protein [Chloroflexaceae bacterium]